MIKKIQKSLKIDNLLKIYFPHYRRTNDPFENIAIYKDKEIKGIVVYSIIYERSEINYILVMKNYRHQNIGTQLLEFAIDEIKKNKCQNISLEVNTDNLTAVNFYLKNNYEIKAVRQNYYGSKDAYLMVKELR